jgi:hypothetical protein
MANKQIYQLNSLTGISGSYLFPVQDQSGSLPLSRISASALQSTILQQNVTNITLQGTTTGSTARLVPGINVTTNTNSQNFCARLPLNTQSGDTVSLINNGGYYARIFPSSTGVSINGVSYFDVPNNGLTYTFVNSNGLWNTLNTGRNISTIVYDVMTISHTTGSSSSAFGVGTFSSSIDGVSPITASSISVGGGQDGNGVLFLIPSSSAFRSEPFNATGITLRCYTNISSNDFARDANYPTYYNDTIQIQGVMVYTSGSFTGTVLSRGPATFIKTYNDTNVFTVPLTTPQNSPLQIGDGGTYYSETSITPNMWMGINPAQGIPAAYYGFWMIIGSGLSTKDYKFRFEIDYI